MRALRDILQSEIDRERELKEEELALTTLQHEDESCEQGKRAHGQRGRVDEFHQCRDVDERCGERVEQSFGLGTRWKALRYRE